MSIYILSVTVCAMLLAAGFAGMRADYENDFYPTALIPAVAGFAIFPAINTGIAVGLGLYVLIRWRKRCGNGHS